MLVLGVLMRMRVGRSVSVAVLVLVLHVLVGMSVLHTVSMLMLVGVIFSLIHLICIHCIQINPFARGAFGPRVGAYFAVLPF